MHAKYVLVSLAIGTRKRFHHWVRASAFELNGIPTTTNFSIVVIGYTLGYALAISS